MVERQPLLARNALGGVRHAAHVGRRTLRLGVGRAADPRRVAAAPIDRVGGAGIAAPLLLAARLQGHSTRSIRFVLGEC